MKQIQNHCSPSKGREMRVQILEGTWEHKDMLSKMGISVSGLTIMKDLHFVNNVFHMVKRKDLVNFKDSEEWDMENAFGTVMQNKQISKCKNWAIKMNKNQDTPLRKHISILCFLRFGMFTSLFV